MEPVTRLDAYALGPTGHLHTKVRLPAHMVADLPTLLKAAQALNPAADADALIRTIWRLGCRAVQRNNDRGVPIRLADLPHARADRDEQLRQKDGAPSDRVSGLRPSRT